MKTTLFIFIFLLILGATNGQTTSANDKSVIFSIGGEVSLPLGTFADAYAVGFGGSAQAEFKPDVDLGITISAGYLYYSLKSTFGAGNGNLSLIPVMAGAKYYFSKGLYGHAQLGAGFGNSKYKDLGTSSTYTNFIYSPGIGYMFTPGVDAELKYMGIANKGGGSSNTVGLRVAYNF